ncbi:MAG: hypothetical protein VYB44_05980 [Bacteroidota bacterium]|nr:hypothetical protein [Bacteroidota bacterium]
MRFTSADPSLKSGWEKELRVKGGKHEASSVKPCFHNPTPGFGYLQSPVFSFSMLSAAEASTQYLSLGRSHLKSGWKKELRVESGKNEACGMKPGFGIPASGFEYL